MTLLRIDSLTLLPFCSWHKNQAMLALRSHVGGSGSLDSCLNSTTDELSSPGKCPWLSVPQFSCLGNERFGWRVSLTHSGVCHCTANSLGWPWLGALGLHPDPLYWVTQPLPVIGRWPLIARSWRIALAKQDCPCLGGYTPAPSDWLTQGCKKPVTLPPCGAIHGSEFPVGTTSYSPPSPIPSAFLSPEHLPKPKTQSSCLKLCY